MAKFFVGCRVKLVRGEDGVSPAVNRAEGFIRSFNVTPAGYRFPDGSINPNDCDCYVDWDGRPGFYSQHTNQLEPILPDGHRPCEEDFTIDADPRPCKGEVTNG